MVCTLQVLGCSGGIGKDLRTTAFLLNDNILIDAGTGVGDLTLGELRKIDYLFLTHSHLDHICSLPFILDVVGVNRPKPLRVFGIKHTIDALKQHILNDVIWPDFTKIPSLEKPSVVFTEIHLDETITLGKISIIALPVNHSIPGNGYWIDSGAGALVFSGDTGSSPEFWQAVNKLNQNSKIDAIAKSTNNRDYLQHLIIETSFTNIESELAKISGHYHPELLVADLEKLNIACNVWITHLKPDEAINIMAELNNSQTNTTVIQRLQNRQVLSF
jgi:cAMP phosphodiesterase